MLEFKPITLEDAKWVKPLIRCENLRSADTSFGAMYLWSTGEERYVARSGDRLVLMMNRTNVPVFLFPFGCSNLVPAIQDMKEYCDAISKPFILVGVPKSYVPVLEKLFPGDFDIVYDRRADDYIYSAEKLSTLAGKALHAKRNHINSFLKTYGDWRFEPLKKEHLSLCAELQDKWLEADPSHIERDVYGERDALLLALKNYNALGFYGGLLWAGGEPIAFSIGEPLCDDTFVVHFEKAVADIRGAYPMINREFVRYIMSEFPNVKYINREDDMGLENMRKAKMSYYPIMMAEKYIATWRSAQ